MQWVACLRVEGGGAYARARFRFEGASQEDLAVTQL
jgi:hypothetical protein